ncbi:hypothetical protein NL389_27475, partial [Klebsiella pneumoniae]|nr:hypothetical protein [Klebsiella pneumoniae]
MVRGIANSKIGFGDLILLLRYFFKLKVSTHPNPFQFKKYEPYYCPSCHRHIIANVWISILLAITQCFICIQLFNAGFQSWGYFV